MDNFNVTSCLIRLSEVCTPNKSEVTVVNDDHASTRLLRLCEVCELIDFGKNFIYRQMHLGQFPPSMKISKSNRPAK
ncbi:MAG: AlpA family phage regulatory protein [Alphaproteobacteria bacterium]|nr:AlpA family phage regulatory protein [Alphaproteobacteria bacterium]